MIANMDREKLINAIIFFAENTRNCSKTKLFKLLFLLDFEHYKATGRSVTGYEYFALPRGPVPLVVHEEFDIDSPPADLEQAVDIIPEEYYGHKRFLVKPKQPFDSEIFSRRELKLLNQLAEEYRFENATDMVDVTHAENSAWDKIWNNGKGAWNKIPYEISLGDGSYADGIMAIASERSAFISHFTSEKFMGH